MNYADITRTENVVKYLNELSVKSLVIYSETSLQKNNIVLSNENIISYSTKKIIKDKNLIDNFFQNFDEFDQIITIGGGTATDVGKYLSYISEKNLICVPTMLSTNAYSTNKVALKVGEKKETLDAVLPTEILLDNDILRKSAENNLYGIADIFSIYTALNDWLLATKFNSETISTEFESAEHLLYLTVEYIKNESIDKIQNDINMLYNLIGTSGEITNKYGSGKPESGSEHIFAKALEKRMKIPHAIAVANGILIMSIAQNLYTGNEVDMIIYRLLKKLGIFELNIRYNITYDLIDNVFLELEPREDRFSIVNLIYNDENIKRQVLIKYKEIYEEVMKYEEV